MFTKALIVALLIPAAGLAQSERLLPRPLSVNPSYSEGFVLYRMNCAGCHGEQGDGRGPNAHLLSPRPTDFTAGVYKLRSTPSGTLPLDTDLARTLENGIHGTMMHPFGTRLGPSERAAVLALIKNFSPRFARESPGFPVQVPSAPERTLERVLHGRDVFQRERCTTCHGEFGRGDGPSSAGLVDERGLPTRPHDFSMSGGVKAGSRPEDVYRSLATGLDGTPMHDASRLSDEDRWALVHYLMVLSEQPSPDIGPPTDGRASLPREER